MTSRTQVMVVRTSGDIFDLPVTGINWSGAKLTAPRTLRVDVVSTSRGLHHKTPVDLGDQLIMKIDGVEYFRGMIISKTRSGDSNITLIADDDLQYLTKNRKTISFKNQSIDQVVKKLCGDFGIPVGAIATSEVKISRKFVDQSLFDIILTYINLTYKKNGVKYYMYDVAGKLTLVKRTEVVSQWVIEKGVNLLDYNLDETVSEIATQVLLTGKVTTKVKVPASKTKPASEKSTTKTIQAKTESPGMRQRFGLFQYYEEVSDETNTAKLLAQATQMLKDKSVITQTFDLEALGIPEVIAGSAVYVIIPELGVKQGFYVDTDTHSFDGFKHTMSLTLTKTDDLPVMDASSTDTTDEEKKAAAVKKTSVVKKKDTKKKGSADKADFYKELITEIKK